MTGRTLARALAEFPGNARHSPQLARDIADACRDLLRVHRDGGSNGHGKDDGKNDAHEALVRAALLHLGGDGERPASSLKDYDHHKYGPFLGVSDEGSAAPAILAAAHASPKAEVLGAGAGPLTLGMGLDAERLGAVGEVPVGPEEYADIWISCAGRLLTTTNVGTRINVRYYRSLPVVAVHGLDLRPVIAALEATFAPFVKTLDGRPRPLTVYVELAARARISPAQRRRLLRSLFAALVDRKAITPGVHHLALAVRLTGGPDKRRRDARAAIDLAAAAGLGEIAITAPVREAADQSISYPGLLHYLAPGQTGPILRHANQRAVRVRTRNSVDPVTVARGIWGTLNGARGMGLDLGKYGVFPLTLEEADAVVGLVQTWFATWSAAPVFFVDQGLLAKDRVYTHGDTAAGLQRWLTMVARHRVPVVLVDTVDKAAGRRLLKTGQRPELGSLGPVQIARLDRFAAQKNIKVLWAGGLTPAEAYRLGQLQVFGIYVTTAAADQRPVPDAYADDPMLAAVKEPTFEGVLNVKILLEAGFVQTALTKTGRDDDADLAAQIDARARAYLATGRTDIDQGAATQKRDALFASTVVGWKVHFRALRKAAAAETAARTTAVATATTAGARSPRNAREADR